MRALVVEDDPLMREALVAALDSRGHTTEGFESAELCLDAMTSSLRELVLLDWMLPGMSGVELLERIRGLPNGDLPVVLIVTSRDAPNDLQAALEAGADDYVRKPVDFDRLLVRLQIAESRVRVRAERHHAEAQLAETMTQLVKSRDDLLSVLDLLRLGCVVVDAGGEVSFASATAAQMLGMKRAALVGPWLKVLPLNTRGIEAISACMMAAPERREKVLATAETKGARAQLEIEVHDDPRDPQRKLLVLYDVTEVQALRRQLSGQASFFDLVGKAPAMRETYQLIRDIAPMDTTVLIQGETGTGKELVARAIHSASGRKNEPFIAVNCAGLTESLIQSQLFGHVRGAFTGAVNDRRGVFEAASGGTLFLDEIGDIPPSVQTSLLRVLQEREITRVGETRPRKVDVRILCATNRNLQEEVELGRFRADLLYRIRVARVRLPPLRERRVDIPLLIATFLREVRSSTGKEVEGLSDEAMRMAMAYDWPGNVRELKAGVEFAAIRARGKQITARDLPPEVTQAGPTWTPTPSSDPQDERSRIMAALEEAGGKRTKAAKLLGISRATFYRRLSKLGID